MRNKIILLFLFSCISVGAQELYDMPKFKSVLCLATDSAYIKARIAVFESLTRNLNEKKAVVVNPDELEIYDALKEELNKDYIKKKDQGNIIREVALAIGERLKSMTGQEVTDKNDSLKIVFHVKEGNRFKNPYPRTQEDYRDKNVKFASKVTDYSNNVLIEICYPDRHFDFYCSETIPLRKTYKDVEINLGNDDDWRYVYGIDQLKMREGFEWIGDSFYKGGMKKHKVHFPEEVEYSVHPNYPEYAVTRFLPNGSDTNDEVETLLLFDQEGNLKRLDWEYRSSFESFSYEKEKETALNGVLWSDFSNNKYNIQNEDKTTIEYARMLVTGEYEELKRQIAAQMMAKVLVGSLAKGVTNDRRVKRKIDAEVNQGAIDATTFLESIDETKMERARQYVEQLKEDHKDEFNIGRRIRLDDTTYSIYFVNNEGKAVHQLNVTYKQTAPFAVERLLQFIR